MSYARVGCPSSPRNYLCPFNLFFLTLASLFYRRGAVGLSHLGKSRGEKVDCSMRVALRASSSQDTRKPFAILTRGIVVLFCTGIFLSFGNKIKTVPLLCFCADAFFSLFQNEMFHAAREPAVPVFTVPPILCRSRKRCGASKIVRINCTRLNRGDRGRGWFSPAPCDSAVRTPATASITVHAPRPCVCVYELKI